MPRPPVQPGNSRPVLSLNLEELKFWLSIMQEHALFIKAGLPVDRREAIQEAQEFYRCFGSLLSKAENVHSDKKFYELVRQTAEKVEEFYRFKRRLLQIALRGELGGSLYPSMLDHVAREAEYFLRLLESMNGGKPFRLWPKTKEESFWLHLMSDHSNFIRQMLDPSEATLIDTAEGFSDEFDELFRQSIDFSSMLRGANNGVPAFGRFLQDSRVAGIRLRDFKRALFVMLEEQKVLSLMTPLFVDHLRREADHFLLINAMLEKNVQTSGYTSVESLKVPLEEEDMEDVMANEVSLEDVVAKASGEPEPTPLMQNMTAAQKLAALQQQAMEAECEATVSETPVAPQSMAFDSEVLEEIDDDEDVISPIVSPTPVQTASKLKYKWSSAWPRPLGGEK